LPLAIIAFLGRIGALPDARSCCERPRRAEKDKHTLFCVSPQFRFTLPASSGVNAGETKQSRVKISDVVYGSPQRPGAAYVCIRDFTNERAARLSRSISGRRSGLLTFFALRIMSGLEGT
jgi:hypothetical protein